MSNDDTLVKRSRDSRGVVTLTLNRPQAYNALSEALLGALQRELDSIAADESVRVVVLRIGVVLGPDGGALAKMMPIFKLGLGGPSAPGGPAGPVGPTGPAGPATPGSPFGPGGPG